MSTINNPVYNPMVKVNRMLTTGEELRRVLTEMETSIALDMERAKISRKKLNQKLLDTTHLLEDETRLNNSLMEEVSQLKNRLTIVRQERDDCRKEREKLEKEVDSLKAYKSRKRKAFRAWLQRRADKNV